MPRPSQSIFINHQTSFLLRVRGRTWTTLTPVAAPLQDMPTGSRGSTCGFPCGSWRRRGSWESNRRDGWEGGATKKNMPRPSQYILWSTDPRTRPQGPMIGPFGCGTRRPVCGPRDSSRRPRGGGIIRFTYSGFFLTSDPPGGGGWVGPEIFFRPLFFKSPQTLPPPNHDVSCKWIYIIIIIKNK